MPLVPFRSPGAALLVGMALVLFHAPVPAAVPHLDLDVRLDPDRRLLKATVSLSGVGVPLEVGLAPAFKLESMSLNGRRQPLPAARLVPGQHRYRLPAGDRLTLSYAGTLATLPAADARQVLGPLPAMADPQGSYLPAGSGWYPDPGQLFTYRLRLSLPPGQKGLVPGALLKETEDVRGYGAEFEFAQPIEGIDLMAGPYQIRERRLGREGKGVLLRAWFHPELADLADAYLDDTARYIERYSRLIGPYPFTVFSIVSAPLPTGFGMPSLTYLGREVLKLPFIRATSLGHEVLHNWWGNGVYPDWDKGNWSEGLTTFMADYAYKEEQSPEAARQTRLGWLRDLAAVPEAEDTPLSAFTARRHGIASIIGYNKAAMVFLMLRDHIGREAFDKGLRLFWQRHRFRTAGWTDLEKAFSESSGQDLSDFFRQWVRQPGAPRLGLAQAEAGDGRVKVVVEMSGDYRLRLPLELLVYPSRREPALLDLAGPRTEVNLPGKGLIQAVDLDPDYRVWRRVDAARFPPILREVFVAPRTHLLVADADPVVAEAARTLASRLSDAPPANLPRETTRLPEGATLIIGVDTRDVLQRLGLAARPVNLAGKGSTQVWAGRDDQGRPYAVISARDADALRATERALPHYGAQSWLLFDGARVADKGVWPPQAERLRVMRAERPARGAP